MSKKVTRKSVFPTGGDIDRLCIVSDGSQVRLQVFHNSEIEPLIQGFLDDKERLAFAKLLLEPSG